MRTACLAGAAALVLTAAACGSSASSPGASSTGGAISASPAKAGGSITVLEGAGYSGTWASGLDPASNTTGPANQDQMEAIFGQLFVLGSSKNVIPDLATGYTMSPDAKTFTIHLRQGVTFSDGTPFNAQAVLWNWQRLTTPAALTAGTELVWQVPRANPKMPYSMWAPGAITAPDPYTIVVHQSVPNSAFVNQLFDTPATWIASPAAFQKEGAKQFAQNPVGAGPFTVVSDTYSSQLVVKKNPHYWQAGRPYLDGITFKTVSSDETAYAAMQAGQGQVYPDLSTTALLNQASAHFQVLNQQGTSPYDLQLNTAIAPFNNPKARQAIYAATNFAPILQHVFGNKYPVVQGFTGPGGICYQPTVPGYQGYDPTLAKQLVQQSGLGKVTINLGTISSSPVAVETTQALQSEWAQAGIHSTIQSYALPGLIAAFQKEGGKWWQSMIQTAGSFDPAASVGPDFRFLSTSIFSGVHDPQLDKLLLGAQAPSTLAGRCKVYDQVQQYIAKNYYGPFYFAFAPANISVKGMGGPGLTTPLPSVAVTPTIPWENVWYNP